jgi:serine/threonine protein kinase
MGAVYRAVDTKTERIVAVKLLLEADDKALARFRREARAAASLRHPNIVGVLDFDIDDPNGAYIVMELVDGVSLHGLLARQGRLAPPRAVTIAMQLLSALAHAHAAGILHRDVKPGNVLVTSTHAAPDFVRLVDFGLAKHTDAARGGPAITTMASMLGTPAYMPPEQMMGETLDARADIYSAGLVLYRMITGGDAYTQVGTERVLAVMAGQAGRPLLSMAPAVPPALAALVDQCIAPDRSQRPGSAAEVIERLARVGTWSPPRLAPDPSVTTAQLDSGVTTVDRPSLGGPALAPAPLALTVHEAPHTAPMGAARALPPPPTPYGSSGAQSSSHRGLAVLASVVGGIFILGALGLIGLWRSMQPDDGGSPASVDTRAPASSAVASNSGGASGVATMTSPFDTASSKAAATSSNARPPAGFRVAPGTASARGGPASAPAAGTLSCFCQKSSGAAICPAPQAPKCSCGGVCPVPVSDDGTCPVPIESPLPPGKKDHDPCIGFTRRPLDNGKFASRELRTGLLCRVCYTPVRVPGTPGATCTGVQDDGQTIVDGVFAQCR